MHGLVGGRVDVYAYFNNDYEGHAFVDAAWLRSQLKTNETSKCDHRRTRRGARGL